MAALAAIKWSGYHDWSGSEPLLSALAFAAGNDPRDAVFEFVSPHTSGQVLNVLLDIARNAGFVKLQCICHFQQGEYGRMFELCSKNALSPIGMVDEIFAGLASKGMERQQVEDLKQRVCDHYGFFAQNVASGEIRMPENPAAMDRFMRPDPRKFGNLHAVAERPKPQFARVCP